MGRQADKIFVNLAVKDLKKSMDFFAEIGFAFNSQFTDEKAACMVISDKIFAMLLFEGFFKTFTKKEISDATKNTEVIVGLSAESREQVDEIVDKALAAGGTEANETIDHGFMYERSFYDLDGHLWAFIYMDASVVENG